MTNEDLEKLVRENAYLKSRCAHLQGDVTELGAELDRMRQQLEHTHARRKAAVPNPLSGGQ